MKTTAVQQVGAVVKVGGLVSTRGATLLLDCCRRTLERMAADGQITKVKIRGATRYRLEELLAIQEGGAS